MKNPITIGDKIFNYKKEALTYYRNILNSYKFGQSLNSEHFNDLLALLDYQDDQNTEVETKIDISGTETGQTEEFSTTYLKLPKSIGIPESFLTYTDAEKLAMDITIETGCRYFFFSGIFNFGDFIDAFIVAKNYSVKRMTISTVTLNKKNVDSLANLLNFEFVHELDLIVSNYFYSDESSNLIPYIFQKLDKGNKFQLAVASTKCKFCIFETTCGKYIVMYGSANLVSSEKIEQIVVEENKTLYYFNDDYHDGIIRKYKTINKAAQVEFNKEVNYFSDIEIDTLVDVKNRYIKPPKVKEIEENFLNYDDAAHLAAEIELEKGSKYFLLLKGSFYFGDFIEALIVEQDYQVKKMTMSTLSWV